MDCTPHTIKNCCHEFLGWLGCLVIFCYQFVMVKMDTLHELGNPGHNIFEVNLLNAGT